MGFDCLGWERVGRDQEIALDSALEAKHQEAMEVRLWGDYG
jgi:hypothetical protein